MTAVTAALLGLGLYLLVALPVAVVVGGMLGGRRTDAAPAEGLAGEARAADGAGAYVALGRPVALVAGRPHAGSDLQLAGAEAYPADS
jgi:hypothetical protein